VDLVERALTIFDKILVAVLENPKKDPLFPTQERVAMIKKIFRGRKEVEVKSFQGLLVEFARANGSGTVIRGLRAVSDFEYEFQMALMNRKLAPRMETLFMMPNLKYSFLSSNMVKEVFMLGGSVRGLVPGLVERKLEERFRKNGRIQIQ